MFTNEFGNFIASVTLHIHEQPEDLSQKALFYFEQMITEHSMALRDDGGIIFFESENSYDEVSYAIDITDPKTVSSFNLIPLFLQNELSPLEMTGMRMKVVTYLRGSVEWDDMPIASEEEPEDAIIFSKGGMFVESFLDHYVALAATLIE